MGTKPGLHVYYTTLEREVMFLLADSDNCTQATDINMFQPAENFRCQVKQRPLRKFALKG